MIYISWEEGWGDKILFRIIFCVFIDRDCSWFVEVYNYIIRVKLNYVNEINLFKKVFINNGILNDFNFLWDIIVDVI